MAARSPLRRALSNFSVLMGGRAVAGVLSVVVLALAARALDAEAFGVLVLVHTAAVVVRGLFNFKPSDTVVRYGVAAFDQSDGEGFGRVLSFTLGLDLICGIASALAMLLVALFAAEWLGLSEALVGPAALYAVALLVSGTGSARGVLRVADRFDAISLQQTVAPVVRLLGIGLAAAFGWGLTEFVLIWVAASLAEYLNMLRLGWRELRRHGMKLVRPSLSYRADDRVWGFVWTVYWQSNLEMAQRHGLILLAGAVLGPAAAGMFRIAREFADVLAKPVVVVRQAVFPDLARLWQQHVEDGSGTSEFRRLCVRLGLLSALVAALVVGAIAIYGALLLELLVGDSYVYGAGLLTWLMLAAAIDFGSASLRPAAYAMGFAARALHIQLVGAAVNVVLFAALLPLLGLTGIGIAAAAASMTVVAAMAWLLAKGAGS